MARYPAVHGPTPGSRTRSASNSSTGVARSSGELRRGREQAVGSQVCGQPTENGASGRDRDLLSDERAEQRLFRVERSRESDARNRSNQRSERLVGAQCLVDGERIRVQVEQPTDARDERRNIRDTVEPRRASDAGPGRIELDRDVPDPVRKTNGTLESLVAGRLEPGDGMVSEKPHEPGPIKRGACR
jgi:hypothetical protein